MIQKYIADLVCYGLAAGLIETEDGIYTANRLLELLGLEELTADAECSIMEFEAMRHADDQHDQLIGRLEEILAGICDYAYEQGLIRENTVTYRDLFDTRVMGLLTDRPTAVTRRFRELYEEDPESATDWYYKFCQDTDYIRRYRISRDLKWVTHTEYGELDVTINLSKPEKDPRAIAAAKTAKQTAYPKCLLCRENVGYAGRVNHPARHNHRVIPVVINNSSWYMQYSPYVYYNEHCIVFNGIHQPMKIDRAAFGKLLDFVAQFPHYFVGSNADLPIVGGSILSHDHFQGGHYEFAMARAQIEKPLTFAGFEDVKAGIVRWPMSVIRIASPERKRLIELADHILLSWRGYTDEGAFIFAETDGEPHNTITPIARKRGNDYELDLVLRNNITTKEHPLGVFHPHAELHHIKKENIGLIEVMGLAVLPSRLKDEMVLLKEALKKGTDISEDEQLQKHDEWTQMLRRKYPDIQSREPEEIEKILRLEIGIVFAKVLEHAGVYKRTPEGKEAFLKFIAYVNEREYDALSALD